MDEKFKKEFTSWISLIKPSLAAIGFKKKNLCWVKTTRKLALVFNIQKNPYGSNVYLNFGIVILSIAQVKESYSQIDCEIGGRLDRYIGHEFLDFENVMPLNKRAERFDHLIRQDPMGFFTIEGEKKELTEFTKKSENMFVTKAADEYLNVPLD
jgi:hypothetical protein